MLSQYKETLNLIYIQQMQMQKTASRVRMSSAIVKQGSLVEPNGLRQEGFPKVFLRLLTFA